MYRPYQKIDRRLTRVMNVGNVAIGGSNPIAVQTMTNTLTKDVKKTNDQIARVVKLGADLVQVYTGLIYKGPGLVEEILNS